MASNPLLLDAKARSELWAAVLDELEATEDIAAWPVAPTRARTLLDQVLAGSDFAVPVGPARAVRDAFAAMRTLHVQPGHPRYFGFSTPAPSTMAVAADALVSALNPQLATYEHSPFGVACERSLLGAFARRFGFVGDSEGLFTSGGAEALQIALNVALTSRFAGVRRGGLRSLTRDPLLYTSVEGHSAIVKAARMAGLGERAVRRVSVDRAWRMKPSALAEAIANDRQAGHEPFLVIATAGTTTTGAIDPLPAIATVAARAGCWLHVDAAWGGLAAFAPSLAGVLAGAENADSLGFDPHKGLCMPLGTGVYLGRRRGALGTTFDASAGYMPRDTTRDPFAHSPLWSRRFVGLRVWLTLAVSGWQGVAASIDHQASLAVLLRKRLVEEGWQIVNDTPLPLVCFVDNRREDGRRARYLASVAARVRATHNAWVSVTRLANGDRALRACVSNGRTQESDIEALIDGLCRARSAM